MERHLTSRVLVTGAGGFLGSAIVSRLVRDDRPVIAASRATPAAPPGVATMATGNLVDSVDYDHLLAGVDCVIHCAARAHVLHEDAATDPLEAFRAINRDATLSLAQAAAEAGVRRFVFMSSIGVNGNETFRSSFTPDDTPQPHSPYAVAKWEAERGLTGLACETGMEVVVIRPPLVIGLNPKGNLAKLITAMRRGLPLPLGAVTNNRRDIVSLDTLIDLIARAIDHPAAPGAPLLVCDGRPLSTREVIERLAILHKLTPRLLPVPSALLGATLGLIGRKGLAAQLLGDLEIDISQTCQRLDWKPPEGATS